MLSEGFKKLWCNWELGHVMDFIYFQVEVLPALQQLFIDLKELSNANSGSDRRG